MGGERHSPLQWPQARGGSPGYNFLLSLHPWQSKTVRCVCVYERVCVCVACIHLPVCIDRQVFM